MNPDELRAELKALGWSQAYFAKRLDVTADTVTRWVTGQRAVPGYVVEYLRVVKLAREILGAGR